jgi:hypothetical protein
MKAFESCPYRIQTTVVFSLSYYETQRHRMKNLEVKG